MAESKVRDGITQRQRRACEVSCVDEQLPAVGSTISLIVPAYNEATNLRETSPASAPSSATTRTSRCWSSTTAAPTRRPMSCSSTSKGGPPRASCACRGIKARARPSRRCGPRRRKPPIFMDADLSADIADVPRLAAALDHADVAMVGARSPGRASSTTSTAAIGRSRASSSTVSRA